MAEYTSVSFEPTKRKPQTFTHFFDSGQFLDKEN